MDTQNQKQSQSLLKKNHKIAMKKESKQEEEKHTVEKKNTQKPKLGSHAVKWYDKKQGLN